MAQPRFAWLSMWKATEPSRPSWPGSKMAPLRYWSGRLGPSILMTRAPMAPSQEVQRGPASTQLKSATVTPESGNGSPSDNPGPPGASQLLGGQPEAPAEDGVVVAPQARRRAADARRRLRELVRRRRRPDGRAAGERHLLDEAPRPHLL